MLKICVQSATERVAEKQTLMLALTLTNDFILKECVRAAILATTIGTGSTSLNNQHLYSRSRKLLIRLEQIINDEELYQGSALQLT